MIVSMVLYGYDIWSVDPREEYRLRVRRRVFGPKEEGAPPNNFDFFRCSVSEGNLTCPSASLWLFHLSARPPLGRFIGTMQPPGLPQGAK